LTELGELDPKTPKPPGISEKKPYIKENTRVVRFALKKCSPFPSQNKLPKNFFRKNEAGKDTPAPKIWALFIKGKLRNMG